LGQIDRQERAARPRDDESCEFDNGECEQLPRDPEIEEDSPEGVWIGLEEFPLLLVWRAFAEERVAFGSGLLAEVGHGAFGGDVGDLVTKLLGVTVVWF
jgi:hypothetical protein